MNRAVLFANKTTIVVGQQSLVAKLVNQEINIPLSYLLLTVGKFTFKASLAEVGNSLENLIKAPGGGI